VTIKGLEELRQNLSNISKNAIPRATSQSINRVAGRAISRSSTRVAKETKVKRKLVMQRPGLNGQALKTNGNHPGKSRQPPGDKAGASTGSAFTT
jgi:hypothetical protein